MLTGRHIIIESPTTTTTATTTLHLKFHKHPSFPSDMTAGNLDGKTDMEKLIVALRESFPDKQIVDPRQ
jgi:hypothetical protein